MAWGRGDTEAFNATMKAGQGLRDMWDKYQAGQAYKEATQVGVSREDNGVDPTVKGLWDNGLAPTIRNADGSYSDNPAYESSGKEQYMDNPDYQVTKRYGLGPDQSTYRAESPDQITPQQKRLAGLQALEAHYSGRGDEENALKYGTAADQMQSAELQRQAAQANLDLAPLHKQVLQGQVDLQPGARSLQETQVEAAQLAQKFKKASMKGLPGMAAFYDDEVKDGMKSNIVKNKDGSVSIMRTAVGEDGTPVPGAKPELWKTFAGNKDFGLDPEVEAAATLHNMMGDPTNLDKIMTINATYTSKKDHNDLLKAMYGARAAAKETPTEVLTGKAEAIADAIYKADETGKMTKTQALKQAYQQLVPGKPGVDPETRKELTTALDTLGPRPQPQSSMFGAPNDKAGLEWDRQRKQILVNHGVAGGGSPLDALLKANGDPFAATAAPPTAKASVSPPASPTVESKMAPALMSQRTAAQIPGWVGSWYDHEDDPTPGRPLMYGRRPLSGN